MKKSEVLAKDEEEFDFEKDLSINKFRLDEECLSHSSIYFRYAEAAAKAKTRAAKAKDNLELVKAERYDEIKTEFEKKGLKTTIPMMDKAVLSDSEVIEATNKLRKAEDISAKLDVAVKAFEHRKSELDNLVKLYCAGYYSMPNANETSKKDVNEQTAREIRKNLNK
jgi:hypothetical protein